MWTEAFISLRYISRVGLLNHMLRVCFTLDVNTKVKKKLLHLKCLDAMIEEGVYTHISKF